jgi:hypothetical protein
MSTTVRGPVMRAARRITSSGKFQSLDPSVGVIQPCAQAPVLVPDVGGAVAGIAGRVGRAVGVLDVVPTGLGIAAVDVDDPPEVHAAAGSARHHRKTMNLLTGTGSVRSRSSGRIPGR